MTFRIGVWAIAGFLVSGFWALYFYAFSRSIPLASAHSIVWNLALLTQPFVLVSFYFHFGMYFYWVMLANAATYALVGLIVEALRQVARPAH